jgi:dihydroneopterin aldolase
MNARHSGLTVVKLGGSLAFSIHLRPWLDALAEAAGEFVLVAGGGPFADAVRMAQPKIGFDDVAAHHMALLAMEQFGRALASLNPALVLADSLAAIRRVLRARKVPVWSPTRMVLAERDIPASWDVTADSLAAWLAIRIGAKRLLMIKHAAAMADRIRAGDLVAAGFVDPAFPRFLCGAPLEVLMAEPSEHVAAAPCLRQGAGIGRRIELA